MRPGRGGSPYRVAALAVAAAALAPGPAAGQGRLLSAHLEADLSAGSPGGAGFVHYPVRIVYRVDPGGEEGMPLAALSFEGNRVVGLRASAAGRTVAVDPVPDAGGRARWEARIPPGGGAVEVEVRYRVRAASGRPGRVALPLPAALWPPVEAAPGTFRARLALPPGRRVAEAFPAGWRLEAPRGGGPEALVTELPVVPALVRVRLEGSGGWTLGRAVDGLVAALFLGLGAAGVVGMRRAGRGGA